jgi:DNA-directed RNA polymerase specialized sigma24 family protein
MNDLDQTLCQMLSEVCAAPLKSPERQQWLGEIYQLVMKSGRLWRESVPYYNDVVQEMWEYCCQHPETYDPSVCSVITWLNDHLKRYLRRYREANSRQNRRLVNRSQFGMSPLDSENSSDLIDTLPSPPDIQPLLEMWKITLDWVNTDPDQVLRKTLFRKRSDINAQILILRRLPPETPWLVLAQTFQLTPAEAKDLPKFYYRKCLFPLRQFGISQGFIAVPEPQSQAGRVAVRRR